MNKNDIVTVEITDIGVSGEGITMWMVTRSLSKTQ